MNSGELYARFRSDVVDVERPYLWSDTEVFAYMADAYRMFVRLTGGIPDVSSAVTQIPVIAGEAFADVSPLILRFRKAYLSSGFELEIVNEEELAAKRVSDYGVVRPMTLNNVAGPVRYMVIGQERNKVRWVWVPTVDDTVQLTVYRLPLKNVEEGDDTFEFSEVGEEHHEFFLLWMKHRAYGKQDAEAFDRGRRDEYEAAFRSYCSEVKAEWERYKHKTRVIAYGGL